MAICEEYGVLPSWDPLAQSDESMDLGDWNEQMDGTAFLEDELISMLRLITLVQCLVNCENARREVEGAEPYPNEAVMKHTLVRARMSRPKARGRLATELLENQAFTSGSSPFAAKRRISQVLPSSSVTRINSSVLGSSDQDDDDDDDDDSAEDSVDDRAEAAAVQMEVDLGTPLGREMETAFERGFILTSDQKRRALAAQRHRDAAKAPRRPLPAALLDDEVVVDDLLADLADLADHSTDDSD